MATLVETMPQTTGILIVQKQPEESVPSAHYRLASQRGAGIGERFESRDASAAPAPRGEKVAARFAYRTEPVQPAMLWHYSERALPAMLAVEAGSTRDLCSKARELNSLPQVSGKPGAGSARDALASLWKQVQPTIFPANLDLWQQAPPALFSANPQAASKLAQALGRIEGQGTTTP